MISPGTVRLKPVHSETTEAGKDETNSENFIADQVWSGKGEKTIVPEQRERVYFTGESREEWGRVCQAGDLDEIGKNLGVFQERGVSGWYRMSSVVLDTEQGLQDVFCGFLLATRGAGGFLQAKCEAVLFGWGTQPGPNISVCCVIGEGKRVVIFQV